MSPVSLDSYLPVPPGVPGGENNILADVSAASVIDAVRESLADPNCDRNRIIDMLAVVAEELKAQCQSYGAVAQEVLSLQALLAASVEQAGVRQELSNEEKNKFEREVERRLLEVRVFSGGQADTYSGVPQLQQSALMLFHTNDPAGCRQAKGVVGGPCRDEEEDRPAAAPVRVGLVAVPLFRWIP